jgi:hypothetical protein
MRAFWIAGVLVLGLTGSAFAQTPPAAANAAPAAAETPAVATLTASAETPLDSLIEEAAPEDRTRMLLRCSGPPPRPIAAKTAEAPKAAPPLPPAKDPLG